MEEEKKERREEEKKWNKKKRGRGKKCSLPLSGRRRLGEGQKFKNDLTQQRSRRWDLKVQQTRFGLLLLVGGWCKGLGLRPEKFVTSWTPSTRDHKRCRFPCVVMSPPRMCFLFVDSCYFSVRFNWSAFLSIAGGLVYVCLCLFLFFLFVLLWFLSLILHFLSKWPSFLILCYNLLQCIRIEFKGINKSLI